MIFANPGLLIAGLACVALPILIHFLMRRRRKPIGWAAMRFLLEAYQKQRKRLRLEQLLLLALRCLLVALIALALGRPMLEAAGLVGGQSSTLIVLLDNSLTSQVRDAQGRLALDRHKASIEPLLAALKPGSGDRAAIITLGGPAQSVVWPPSSDVPAVRRALEAVKPTDSAADIAGAITIASAGETSTLTTDTAVSIAVISDFLRGSVDLRTPIPPLRAARAAGDQQPSPLKVLATAPASTSPTNVAVLSVEAQRGLVLGSQPLLATAQLRRTGASLSEATDPIVFRLSTLTGQTLSQAKAVARWRPGQNRTTVSAMLSAPDVAAGQAVLTAGLETGSAGGDDVARMAIERRTALRVAVLAQSDASSSARSIADFDPASWLMLALNPQRAGEADLSNIEASILDPMLADASRLAVFEAVLVPHPEAVPAMVWTRLRALIDAGGLVVIMPPPTTGAHAWAEPMIQALGVPWRIELDAAHDPAGRTLTSTRAVGEIPRDLLAPIAGELTALAEPVRIFRWLRVTRSSPGSESPGEPTTPMLALADGTPLLLADAPSLGTSRGLAVLLATAPNFEWTNLPAKPLFPALIQEIVKQGIGRARAPYFATAGQAPAMPPLASQLVAIGEAQAPIRATDSGRAAEPIRHAGLWKAADAQGATQSVLVIQPDHTAGVTDVQSQSDVQAWLAGAGGAVTWLSEAAATGQPNATPVVASRDPSSGIRLSLALLLGALVAGLLEIALARWFSHATTGPTSEARS